VGGTSDAALRRAARYGDGWICAFASERKFARLVEALRGFLAEARRPADGFTLGTFLFANVGPDPAQALAEGAEYVRRVYQLDGAAIVERFGAAGPVEHCVERVRAQVAAGAQYIVLSPVCGYRAWPYQLESFGEVIARVGRG
jgi:alkanesulfonate monooxygenase SsuD/methylene tetrahydromethanopterin reductase-like flavin-dependent oxidoreductase (luciferase family)